MIVAVVAERTPAAVRAHLDDLARRFRPGQLMAEVRLDALDEPDPQVLWGAPLALIASCRRRMDGGFWRGSESDRLALLRAAFDVGGPRPAAPGGVGGAPGVRYIDVEVDRLPEVRWAAGARLLASLHDFGGTPGGLSGVVARAISDGAAMVKLATRATDLCDVLALRRAAFSAPGSVVAFGLGPGGVASRLLFRRMGGPWVYARSVGGSGVLSPASGAADPVSVAIDAPGLPALDDLVGRYYPSADLPEPASVFGVLSDHPEHSIGPWVFNRIFRDRGLPAIYVPLQASGVGPLRYFLSEMGIDGVSVTTPYKEDAVRLVDFANEPALRLGAANTIVAHPSRGLLAFNTDVAGVQQPVWEAFGGAEGRGPALVLGAGGAARAAVVALQNLGFDVFVAARTEARAEAVARDLGARSGWAGGIPRVLVNATPAGGPRDLTGFPARREWLGEGQIVLEMNYGLRATPLERESEARGATVIPGAAMYSAQAREQLVHFGIEPPSPAEMQEIVAWALAAQGIVLIGLRRSGKTTVGRLLAPKLLLPFVDLDEAVAAEEGMTTSAILLQRGEEEFRRVESRVLAGVLRVGAAVLAAGGGTAEIASNRELLRRWGTAIYIELPVVELLERLSGDAHPENRPLLLGRNAREETLVLHARRDPIYRAMAKIVVNGAGTPEEVCARCVAALGGH